MYIAFAMGTLGSLLGVWIALSQSPVVVTVLPLLFGVIGGAGGYSLLKIDLSKPHNQQKIRLISIGLGSLCLTCLVFMVAAMLSRPLLRDLTRKTEIDITASASPMRALIMRARLQALGATDDEIKFILEPPAANISAKDQVSALAKNADDYVKIYNAVPSNDQEAMDAGYREDNPGAIAAWCELFIAERNALSLNGQSIDDNRAALLLDRATFAKIDVTPNSFDDKVQRTFLKYPDLIAARIRLFDTLQAAKTISKFTSSPQEIEQADAVIKLIASVPKQTREPLSIAMSPNQSNF